MLNRGSAHRIWGIVLILGVVATQLLGVPQGQAVDLGGVLPVADHEIHPQRGGGLAEGPRQVFNGAATHNVADGQNFHDLRLFL